MSLKALIATLVLGSSSVALAAPFPSRVQSHFADPTLRIANDLVLNGRSVIKVDSSKSYYKLQLALDGKGKVDVSRVVIYFKNGHSQEVSLRTSMSKQNPTLSIDLTGNKRFIDRVVIDGTSRNRKAALDIVAL